MRNSPNNPSNILSKRMEAQNRRHQRSISYTQQCRLKKAMYGLRASPRAWQDHLARVLQRLGYIRLVSCSDIHTTKHTSWSMLTTSCSQERSKKSTGSWSRSSNTCFSDQPESQHQEARFPSSEGNHKQRQLLRNYDNILQEAQLELTCNPATTPGTTATKGTIEDEELLNLEQRKHYDHYGRMVGKLTGFPTHGQTFLRNKGASKGIANNALQVLHQPNGATARRQHAS